MYSNNPQSFLTLWLFYTATQSQNLERFAEVIDVLYNRSDLEDQEVWELTGQIAPPQQAETDDAVEVPSLEEAKQVILNLLLAYNREVCLSSSQILDEVVAHYRANGEEALARATQKDLLIDTYAEGEVRVRSRFSKALRALKDQDPRLTNDGRNSRTYYFKPYDGKDLGHGRQPPLYAV